MLLLKHVLGLHQGTGEQGDDVEELAHGSACFSRFEQAKGKKCFTNSLH